MRRTKPSRAAVAISSLFCVLFANPAQALAQGGSSDSRVQVDPDRLRAPESAAHDAPPVKPKRPTIFGRPIRRQGFHFQATLGAGFGPDVVGLYHAMEIGWSFSGYSVSLLHTFLQNKGVFGTQWGGPDEIGGFMLQVKGPLYFDDLSWKLASGVGGTVDQSDGGFDAKPGFGVHYGVDLHFPIWPKFGPTLSLDGMNVVERGHHHFGAGLALGFSVF